jgi:methyl-accepting chemotaxis protein
MYGDSDQVRRRVSQLRDQGADVRALADQLVARTDALRWTGRAADAMRERIAERAAHLRSAADAHASAADVLDKHVQAVEAVKEEIATIEGRAADLVADARSRLAAITAQNDESQGLRITPNPEDEILAGFVPPAPGHRDWLSVELPGL